MEAQASQALKNCQDIQHMIDITTQHLERLRVTFNNASDELTKQEIRTLEGKLVKHFSEQLAVKYGLGPNAADLEFFPSLTQWLQVVGVSSDTKDAITQRVRSLEDLKDKTECELKRILLTASRVPPAQRQEDLRRLCRSLQNLRKYTDVLVYGSKMYGPGGDASKLELFWDSWDTIAQSKSECSSPKHSFSMPPRLVHISSDELNRPPGSAPSGHDSHIGRGSQGQRIPHCQVVSDRIGGGDSASSSLSSSSSAPPPSPGCATLSPPVISENLPPRLLTTPPPTPSWKVLGGKDRNKSTQSNLSKIGGKSFNSSGRIGPGGSVSTPPASKKLSTSGVGVQDWSSLIKSDNSQSSSGCSSGRNNHAGDNSNHNIPHGNDNSNHQTDVRIEPGDNVDSSGYSSSSSEAPNLSRRRLQSADVDIGSDYHSNPAGISGPSPSASPKSPAITSSIGSGSVSHTSLQVPRSPRTPGNLNLPFNRPMAHSINHRFTKTFKPARCDLCQELFFQGMKCKECKKRYHTICQQHVPPSCGLPEPLLEHFINQMSPNLPSLIQPPPFESSSSSCNSSTPSSPQVIVTSHPTHPTPPWAARAGQQHFRFPDTTSTASSGGFHHHHHHQMTSSGMMNMGMSSAGTTGGSHPYVDTVKSNDSDKTLSGSSDSIGTAYRLDSQDSTTSVEGDGVSTWSSGRQMSIREWDIPYEELKIQDKIGSGRFSTVHMGNWHGDVAIKFLDMENNDDESTLEAFKLDVATFRKTRHENLILFMGACMKPPKLAIVTSLCKGNTLYTHLHLRRDKFFMNKIILIAQQIALGMGYLHHKGIVHKDLKTKNIFLENGRAIITDFGLVNVAQRLCSRHKHPGETAASHPSSQEYMSIPAGWLCYLAPELIRELRVVQQTRGEDLPFTRASDVYAFGTVWYELLTGEWPWKQQPPEAIIWQAGRGMKPSLANLQANRDVKDILVQCWLYNPDQRPDFSGLLQTLEKIPKKRLARSPSHPVHLSRSAESETAQNRSELQEAWSPEGYKKKSSKLNKEKSSNEQTEEEWLRRLCMTGNKIAHDAGMNQDFKVEVDEKLSLKGKQFFQDNFFMVIVNMFIGLISILYIPNIARILKITGKSGSTALSFQRYLSTLIHAIQWFQSSEDMSISLKQVLALHRAGSYRGQKEGLNKTGQKEISKGITQFDMVVTQWGFIGPALVFNHRIPFYSQGDSEEGFIYIMYLVGKSLGILDEYNLCSGTVQQTKQRCNLVLREVLQPCLENRDDLSEQMTFHLLNGVNVLNPLIVERDFKSLSDKLLLEEKLSDENGSTVYQLYLFFFQKVMYMPGSWIIRVFTNSLLKYNIWLAGRWSSYIFQIQCNYEHSYILCD